ncbi:MAG: hypothetical protein GC159_07240 [Phycisphaera sp.]|nr:hypothetical protein [Phycisphaera sp.]
MYAQTHDQDQDTRALLHRLHQTSLYGFIGFLTLGALWGIITVLTGHFGWLEARVLLTAAIVSVSSACLLTCVNFASRTSLRPLSIGGAGVVVTAATLLMIGMWGDVRSEAFWKLACIATTWGVALTHGFLILGMRLHRRFMLPQLAVVLTTAVLALMFSLAILDFNAIERIIGEQAFYRIMASVAILVALGSVAMPILRRISKSDLDEQDDLADDNALIDNDHVAQTDAGATAARQSIVLTDIGDGVYSDAHGQRYRLVPVMARQS